MKSMTGLGRATFRDKNITVDVELRSLNHRFFKLITQIPEEFTIFEKMLEGIIRKKVIRGNINLKITLEFSRETPHIIPDIKTLENHYHKLINIKNKLGLSGDISLDLLLGLRQAEQKKITPTPYWFKTRELVERALGNLLKMREREGEGIKKECIRLIRSIEKSLRDISTKEHFVIEQYRKNLQKRITAIAQREKVDIPKSDLIKEIVFFAEKSDISEELQRLTSHIKQFTALLGAQGEIGRKLDFLAQEMARESNTIATKSVNTEITQHTIEMRCLIEKLREQVENIE